VCECECECESVCVSVSVSVCISLTGEIVRTTVLDCAAATAAVMPPRSVRRVRFVRSAPSSTMIGGGGGSTRGVWVRE
jgi:hypothetical protein